MPNETDKVTFPFRSQNNFKMNCDFLQLNAIFRCKIHYKWVKFRNLSLEYCWYRFKSVQVGSIKTPPKSVLVQSVQVGSIKTPPKSLLVRNWSDISSFQVVNYCILLNFNQILQRKIAVGCIIIELLLGLQSITNMVKPVRNRDILLKQKLLSPLGAVHILRNAKRGEGGSAQALSMRFSLI